MSAEVMSSAGIGVTVHSFYVPAGGDIPDAALNAKFAHKLGFLGDMHEWSAQQAERNARPSSRAISTSPLTRAMSGAISSFWMS